MWTLGRLVFDARRQYNVSSLVVDSVSSLDSVGFLPSPADSTYRPSLVKSDARNFELSR